MQFTALVISAVALLVGSSQAKLDHAVKPEIECRRGPIGKKGKTGFTGPRGVMGAQGEQGDPGVDATFMNSAFINVINKNSTFTISSGDKFPLTEIQSISNTGHFELNTTTNDIRVLKAGSFFASFTIAVMNDDALSTVGLFINEVLATPGQFASFTSFSSIYGQSLIHLVPGDVVSLRSLTGQDVGLKPSTSFNNVKTSLMLIRVSDGTLISGELAD